MLTSANCLDRFYSGIFGPETAEEAAIHSKTDAPSDFWESMVTETEVEETRENLVCAELENFVKEKNIPRNDDPLQWWRNNGVRYPYLAKLSRVVLGLPATATSSERVWSSAGNTVSARRQSLSPDSIRDVVFLHENQDLCQ